MITSSTASSASSASPSAPTIVLVHGALTDASVWHGVMQRLHARGLRVVAPAMPLRGLASDAAYLGSFLGTVGGPVILVGHSWAGAVITQEATRHAKVVALVYIAAFQPDEGETAGELNGRFPGSKLGPDTTLVRAGSLGDDLYLAPASFREVYAADLPEETAATLAAAQRPIDPAALGEPLRGAPAWRTLPSWALVSTRDASLPPAALRFMAARAGSQVREVESSHAAPLAQPDAVAALVVEAVATSPSR